MKKINIAVLGLGYWGPNLVRNLLEIPNVSEIYGCDLLEKTLASIKQKYPMLKTTTNYSEILDNKNIDAILIATPMETHFELAKKGLLGKKHVFIEKPITKTSQEAKELINLSKKQKKILMAGHTFVYSEAVKKIKRFLEKKGAGRIYYYDSTRVNLGRIKNDSDVIWDLATHDLSILSYLFEEKPISIQAFGSSFIGNQYELAHIFIKFKNNISAHIQISWISPVKIRSITIGGSKKMIVWNDIEPTEKIKIYDKGVIQQNITPFSPAYRSGDIIIPKLEQNEALFNELLHFTDCILNNKNPITNGTQGLKVVTLLEAISRAILTGKEVFL